MLLDVFDELIAWRKTGTLSTIETPIHPWPLTPGG